MAGNAYDVLIIGSGPGGASLAQRLAPTGRTILLLERGDYLPRSVDNWDSQKVFVEGVYQTKETWYGKDRRVLPAGPALLRGRQFRRCTVPRCSACASATSTSRA